MRDSFNKEYKTGFNQAEHRVESRYASANGLCQPSTVNEVLGELQQSMADETARMRSHAWISGWIGSGNNSMRREGKTLEKSEQMRWIRIIIWILVVLLTTPLFAETQVSRRSISATWVDNPPVIDGDLSDSVWQKAQISTNFFRANE